MLFTLTLRPELVTWNEKVTTERKDRKTRYDRPIWSYAVDEADFWCQHTFGPRQGATPCSWIMDHKWGQFAQSDDIDPSIEARINITEQWKPRAGSRQWRSHGWMNTSPISPLARASVWDKRSIHIDQNNERPSCPIMRGVVSCKMRKPPETRGEILVRQ
jgi:hypothetical protein